MKSILFTLVILFLSPLNAQDMNDPKNTVFTLFKATDDHQWNIAENTFADKVELDYSSMNGNPAVVLSPLEIITSWKGILPGFESTHHQLGNVISKIEGTYSNIMGLPMELVYRELSNF